MTPEETINHTTGQPATRAWLHAPIKQIRKLRKPVILAIVDNAPPIMTRGMLTSTYTRAELIGTLECMRYRYRLWLDIVCSINMNATDSSLHPITAELARLDAKLAEIRETRSTLFDEGAIAALELATASIRAAITRGVSLSAPKGGDV